MTDPDARPIIRLAHSPDPDDAFMWWPLLAVDGEPPTLDTGRFRFEVVVEDIETLNRRSEDGDLEITAMSCAQYARVHSRYALTACGASLGDGLGPKLVARNPCVLEDLAVGGAVGGEIAVPGERTSAFGALNLMLGAGAFNHCVVPFEEIIDRVAAGEFEAGLVIHEGQLTFGDAGLHLVEDVGAWWGRRTGLPMPLGVNAIRRDLEDEHGAGTLVEITGTLLRSVQHALAHRPRAVEYALRYARDMGAERADTFIGMYVNAWTLDFGRTGREAVARFLAALHDAGVVPDPGRVDFIEPLVPS